MARTKEFDKQVVLTKAMNLFWEQGYEKTSMQELVDRIGIHRRSIYDTFGDKHQLFLKSLALYEDNLAKRITQRVSSDESVQGKIRRLLSITLEQDENQPAGCLIVNTASELALIDEEVSQKINVNGCHIIFSDVFQSRRNGKIAFPAMYCFCIFQ